MNASRQRRTVTRQVPSSAVPKAGDRLAELDEFEVVVDKLVDGGEGLARIEGIPVFIPRSAPGDHLRVRLVERRPDYGRAEIVKILEPGPHRRTPPCTFFGNCGGCDLQHLDDHVQTELKAAAVCETLQRLGGVDPGIAVEVIDGMPWSYRIRAQLHTVGEDDGLRVGYRARRSDQIVEIDDCPILAPRLRECLADLRQRLPARPPRRLDLLVGDDGSLSTAPVTPSLPRGEITISVGDFQYDLDARCFFQSHRELLPILVDRVVGPWTGQEAFDLYAGVGLISLPLARRYRRVVAVEGDRVAARFARRNARRHRLERVETRTSAVESWISDLPQNAERVVVDPPRLGLSRQVRSELRARRPRRLTYVSCHPAALARDLKVLSDRFEIETLSLLDMFPQTGHMEVVVQLRS